MAGTFAGVALTGTGSAVPDTVLTNDDLAEVVETSDEWIKSRTGISARRLLSPAESLTSLAVQAGKQALSSASLAATDLDLILLATSTANDRFGSATQIQHQLGAKWAVAFDLTAACSGFVFGLVTAAQFIRTGTYRNILLIGADVLSHWVDWSDRRSCVLFGDGAGAVVIQAHWEDRLLGFELRSDGSDHHHLNIASRTQPRTLTNDVSIGQQDFMPIAMNGQEVYKFAVRSVPEVIDKALYRSGVSASELDWLLLHQANKRILDAVALRLAIPPKKVISNLENYGNTSAASIPLALDEWVRLGHIQPGHLIAASGFGAGLSWGAAVFRWAI
ncbi:MAG: ketoacyl-ACP synthase III [Spirirestis rafaelensis WJT71-NPBG6]|nr:ketoacyl-ACP synthase III [Spirirestis rafaelensis WJT71-NPBG6]